MFQWAQSKLDKLAQHVAPPPDDGPSRYAYCLQRGDEDAAMGCMASMDPVHTVINQVKGQYPIHLACQYSYPRLMELLLNQPGMNVQQTDLAGNTPLHYASMSTAPNGLDIIKLLITNYGASVVARNTQGQTPYDVATLNSIRQYLLPIQLQAETQIALDNGGQGLPPGIDLGGMQIKNSTIAPPPTFAGPPGSTTTSTSTVQSPNMSTAATSPSQTTQVTPAPSSREYSRVGSSSAALGGKYRADGFHSSSSDVSLQKKYGHATVGTYSNIAPPPSSGNSVGVSPVSGGGGGGGVVTASGGTNPFAAGGRYVNRRYVAYGQVATPAATAYPYPVSSMSAPSSFGQMVSFVPSSSTTTVAATTTATPSSYGAPMTTPYMPPPPYQSQNMGNSSNSFYPQNPAEFVPQYPSAADTAVVENHAPNPSPWSSPSQPPTDTAAAQAVVQNSANLADACAQDVFTAPSPQKEVPSTTMEPATNEPQEEIVNHAMNESTPATDGTSYASPTLLPEHWVEAVDPSSGQTYYYNSVTHETSWEIPTALPENWVEATDPTSGQVYYYNHVTQETSWDKPTVPSTEVVAAILSASPEEQAVPAATTESEGALLSASETFDSSVPVSTEPPISANHTWNLAAPTLYSVDPLVAEAAFTSPAIDSFNSAVVPSSSSPAKDAAAISTFDSPADAFNSTAPSSSVVEPLSTNAVISPAEAFGSAAPSPLVVDNSAINTFNFPAPPSAMDSAVASAIASSLENHAVPEPTQISEPTPSITNSSFSSSPPPMSSLFVAPPRRKMSADELFAEDPPQEEDETNVIGDGNNMVSSPARLAAEAAMFTPHKPTPDSTVMDEFDGDGTLDDIPLSPDLQRPIAEGVVAAVDFPTTTATTTTSSTATLPMDNAAESLFAAIGMPPPPFSARKR